MNFQPWVKAATQTDTQQTKEAVRLLKKKLLTEKPHRCRTLPKTQSSYCSCVWIDWTVCVRVERALREKEDCWMHLFHPQTSSVRLSLTRPQNAAVFCTSGVRHLHTDIYASYNTWIPATPFNLGCINISRRHWHQSIKERDVWDAFAGRWPVGTWEVVAAVITPLARPTLDPL